MAKLKPEIIPCWVTTEKKYKKVLSCFTTEASVSTICGLFDNYLCQLVNLQNESVPGHFDIGFTSYGVSESAATEVTCQFALDFSLLHHPRTYSAVHVQQAAHNMTNLLTCSHLPPTSSSSEQDATS